jgi:prevent-host-death family protein
LICGHEEIPLKINMLEAKNQLSRLVKAAQAGEEVIIANHGVPVVRLVPIDAAASARSLASELTELRDLMQSEKIGELPVPARDNRANPFTETAPQSGNNAAR